MKKPVFSYRIDPDLILKAQTEGIDLPRFFEIKLQERLNLNKCPMCGTKHKVKK